MILSRKHLNGWDVRGAITRQFSLFTWEIVNESCGGLLQHNHACDFLPRYATFYVSGTRGDDDGGRVPEQCLNVRLRGP